MINQEQFYKESDYPSGDRRKKMWGTIEREIRPEKKSFLFVQDRMSFVYGIAASVILYFTAVGVVSTVRNSIANAQPEVVRLDEAYRSAIEQFEQVAQRDVVASTGDPRVASYISAREEQLQKLNSAINELRLETKHSDVSPLKQKRLRQLYSLKLHILQEMVENGEIDL